MRCRKHLQLLTVTGLTMLLANSFLGERAYAQIILDMGGNPACRKTSTSPHDTLSLTGVTCQDPVSGNTVTITNSGGGQARLEREANPADTTIDQIRMVNAKITTNGPIQNFHITFWRTFAQGPNFLPTTTYYRTRTIGTLTQNNPPGSDPGNNSIAVTGYVANPTTAPFLQMGVQKVYTLPCPPTCSFTFSALTTSQLWPRTPNPPYHDLTGDRLAKVDIVLTLFNANDSLDLGSTNSIKINSQPTPDDGIADIGTGHGGPGDQLPHRCSSNFFSCVSETTQQTSQSLFQSASLTDEQKLKVFARSNWDNLQHDLARGGGEYLSALAAILNIPPDQEKRFFELGQERFSNSGGNEMPEVLIASLHETWDRQSQR